MLTKINGKLISVAKASADIPISFVGDGGDAPTAEEFAKLQTQLATLTTQMTTITEERDTFKAKHTEAEKHRKKSDDDAKAAVEEALRKSGDITAIEKSWQEKLDVANNTSATEITSLQGIIQDVTVGAASSSMANIIAVDGSAAVLIPHIKSRLTMEMREGKPHIAVLGKDGKASATTLDELKIEISENAAFAPIIKGSSASGTGKVNEGNKGGKNQVKRAVFDTWNVAERNKFIMKDGGTVVD